MSLIDWDSPQQLSWRARMRSRRDPDWKPEPDLYCPACEEPHGWCACEDRKAA